MKPDRHSHTAHRVAIRRAAHQLLDHPPVLDDPVALPILGAETAAALRADPSQFERGPLAPFLRAFMAARARFAEEQLAALRATGVRQCVILGAGLDTFAYRNTDLETPLRVWEVDHPATQAWKRQRLREAGIAIPAELSFVPVNFEHDSLPDELARAGFDLDAGAFFSWLGVTQYLTRPAIFGTLAFIARATRRAGGVVFDYSLSRDLLTDSQRAVYDALAARVNAAGEPWTDGFNPITLMMELCSLGFAAAQDVSGEELNGRYFAGRADGLRVGTIAHLMWAGATPLDLPPQQGRR
jgi:methyltransferase (TIGR00027 family)